VLAVQIAASAIHIVLAIVFAYLATRFYAAGKSGEMAMTALFLLMSGILLDTVYWGISTFYTFFPEGSYLYQLLLGIRIDPMLWMIPKLGVLLAGLYAIYTMRKIAAE